MKYPEIYQVSFGSRTDALATARDAELVAALIGEIVELVQPECIDGNFTAGKPWRVCVNEYSDEERDLGGIGHFLLDVGEGMPKLDGPEYGNAQRVYCASTAAYSVENHDGYTLVNPGMVVQESGILSVTVFGDFAGNSACRIARKVANIYEDLHQAIFPDVFIIFGDYEEP